MEILSIEEIRITQDEYVYDLETEDGTYYAGSTENLDESILLKNTDSCYTSFIHVNKNSYMKKDPETGNEVFDEIEYMKEIFRISKECATRISATFKRPINIEFEKVMYPFFLFEKKRYAYQEWDVYEHPEEKLEYKGLAIKRRDSCIYVKEVYNTIMEILMKQQSEDKKSRGNPEEAIKYVKQAFKDLLEGKVPIEKLVVSQSLKNSYKIREDKITKEINWVKPLKRKTKDGKETGEILKDSTGNPLYDPDAYKIPKAHVHVAMKLREKDPANYPRPPDRVPYVYIQNTKAKLQFEKAVHPSLIGDSMVDTPYYLERQLLKPIGQIVQILVDQGYIKSLDDVYKSELIKARNRINGQREITSFFKKKEPLDTLSKNEIKEIDYKKYDKVIELEYGEIEDDDENSDS